MCQPGELLKATDAAVFRPGGARGMEAGGMNAANRLGWPLVPLWVLAAAASLFTVMLAPAVVLLTPRCQPRSSDAAAAGLACCARGG